MHYNALQCNALLCTTVHCNALQCTAMHYNALNVLQCTAMHCDALQCILMHCPVLLCTALHCAALFWTALLCTALHQSVMIQKLRPSLSWRIIAFCVYLFLSKYTTWCMKVTIERKGLKWCWSDVYHDVTKQRRELGGKIEHKVFDVVILSLAGKIEHKVFDVVTASWQH